MNKFLLISGIAVLLLIAGFFIISGTLNANTVSSNPENLQKISLNVAIPCPGHAYLIKGALNSLNGVETIEYTPIRTFIVSYDSTKISEQDILNLDIFNDYPAKKIS